MEQIYNLCKSELKLWFDSQSWMKQNLFEMVDRIYQSEKSYIETHLIPALETKLKSDFEKNKLPYLESLAEHYIDNRLPFENELIDEIVHQTVKEIIDSLYERITQEFVESEEQRK